MLVRHFVIVTNMTTGEIKLNLARGSAVYKDMQIPFAVFYSVQFETTMTVITKIFHLKKEKNNVHCLPFYSFPINHGIMVCEV